MGSSVPGTAASRHRTQCVGEEEDERYCWISQIGPRKVKQATILAKLSWDTLLNHAHKINGCNEGAVIIGGRGNWQDSG